MNWRAKPAAILQNFFWALLLGIASGLACAGVKAFFRLLQWLFTGNAGLLSQSAAGLPLWFRAALPAAGSLAALSVIWLSRRSGKAEKFNGYVAAYWQNGGHIIFLPTLWRTLSSGFSVATGAAIGKEGSMIQFAAAVTSWLGRRTGLAPMPLTTQVACGVAAAVATAYQAPFAGMFFAAEIVMGGIVPATLPLLLVSALAGSFTGAFLLGRGPLFPAPAHLSLHLNMSNALAILLFAGLMGALGPAYYRLIRSLRFAAKWPVPLLWSGILVGVLSLKSTLVWGNGDAAILDILQASPAVWAVLSILVLRLSATAFCVGTGAAGGVFTPTLFAGSALGFLAAHAAHLPDPVCFAILGMGSLLAATTHAPLMAAFVTVELTGQWQLLLMLLVANLIAWIVARSISRRSLYALASPEPASDAGERDGEQRRTKLPERITAGSGSRK